MIETRLLNGGFHWFWFEELLQRLDSGIRELQCRGPIVDLTFIRLALDNARVGKRLE